MHNNMRVFENTVLCLTGKTIFNWLF